MTQKYENYRMLIVSRDAREILLRPGDMGFELPRIVIPADQRIAAGVVNGVKEQLQLCIVALYEIFPQSPVDGCGDYYHAAVPHSDFPDVLEGMVWMPVRSVIAESFLQRKDALAVEALWSKWQATKDNCQSEPFVRPEWFSEVTDWVARALQSHFLFLTGSFRQLNASSTFSLIEFDTNRRPVWFKAVGDPNTREFAVTLVLANICPEYLPTIIASKPAWRAWLTEEAAGTSLAAANCARPWQMAAEALAGLQLLMRYQTQLLCESGVRDLRSRQLVVQVPHFFECMEACRLANDQPEEQQFQTTDFSTLRDAVFETLSALGEFDVPDTIGHMDLNPQNIFCSESGGVFLDWAESFIGCPFFSFEYLQQHFRRTPFADSLSEADLRKAYFGRWHDTLSPQDIHAVMQLVPLAALFSYATTLSSGASSDGLPSPAQRRYLLRLLRKMDRMTRPTKEVCA
jgi:phosphotransferase family enzyme